MSNNIGLVNRYFLDYNYHILLLKIAKGTKLSKLFIFNYISIDIVVSSPKQFIRKLLFPLVNVIVLLTLMML